MEVKKRKFDDVFEIQLAPKEDIRGFFMRVYDNNIFKKYNIHREWVQENHSLSIQRGVIRGLHFQFPPYTETKLVRVIRGEIIDVFVDLRKNSPTFGKWESIKLSSENKKMIYIPRGFAHGFCTLTNNCEIVYKVDNYYSPKFEGGLKWDDPELNIDWSNKKPILSEKDANQISFKEFIEKYDSLEVNE